MPPGTEAGRNRRLTLDALLAAVVAVWSVGLLLVVATKDDGQRTDPAAGPEVATAAVPEAEPPSADEVIAAIEVEAGLTPGTVQACDSEAGNNSGFYPRAEYCDPDNLRVIGETVSYAIVVENTGDQVIRHLPITYSFLGDAGEVVEEPETAFSDSDLTSETVTVPQIQPGERLAVGRVQYLEHNDVADMQIEVGEPQQWMSEDYHTQIEPTPSSDALTTSDIDVSYGDQNEPVVSFTIESRHDEAISTTYAYIVFRDDEGRIIGGTYGYVDSDYGSLTIAPDDSVDVEIAVDDPMEIPDIDPAGTEIHLSDQYL
jgi:hypothetical protein